MRINIFVLGFVLINSIAYGSVLNAGTFSESKGVKILVPRSEEKAYSIAGETFADMWEKVTGYRPSIGSINVNDKNLPEGNIILIGSDAVNPLVHELIMTGVIDGLGLQYGGDDYRLLSLKRNTGNCLIIAGGGGRSTIYGVYDYFRKKVGVEYFWDGDIIPHNAQLSISDVDVLEKPHFEYRGLRYFAHRGLHRFRAEHWDLDDWKQEIDWMMKKRFNLFMMRTGIDDLFQRAFPENVPYPPVDGQDPDAQDRSYNDRTSFWPLKYRGELRKEVLKYARDRGLIHPEDVGTITHWYSHTPSSFYKNQPEFPVIQNQKSGYSLPTQAIWDIESQEAWDAYWKLTQTHINEFGGGSPRIFHTIGMAERVFGSSDRENLQMKLYVYRQVKKMISEKYPELPLLVGSWDFIGWNWNNIDVQKLLGEFDPHRTIILDYTADKGDKVTYKDWDIYRKFPWIFGVFHGLAKNSDIHEDYSILSSRLKEATEDPFCKGLVYWSEISHSDNFLLEYIAENSWNPVFIDINNSIEQYCKRRYPEKISNRMVQVWQAFLNISQSVHWRHDNVVYREPQFRLLSSGHFINLTSEQLQKLRIDYNHLNGEISNANKVLSYLIEMGPKNFENELWLRDALDISRTIINRALFVTLAKGSFLMEDWRNGKTVKSELAEVADQSQKLMSDLSDVLSMSDDFSLYASLGKLKDAEQINGLPPSLNPHTELTLKGNAENDYCRNHQYELVKYVYEPELRVYWDWVFETIESKSNLKEWKRPSIFAEKRNFIQKDFYDRPIKEMRPKMDRNSEKFVKILKVLNENIDKLFSYE